MVAPGPRSSASSRRLADQLWLLDWSVFCVDTTVARATRSDGGAQVGDTRPSRPRQRPGASAGDKWYDHPSVHRSLRGRATRV